jgi:hypothetical protein
VKKSPVLALVTKPVQELEANLRRGWLEEMDKYEEAIRKWKALPKKERPEPPKRPRAPRYMQENTTIEAMSEVLRTDREAKNVAPARKVLLRQDEMTEWVSSFDRYSKNGGGSGNADRAAWLRAYNGASWTVDRIGRGAVYVDHWSAAVLGGIQPDPIRRIAAEAAEDGLLQRFCYCVPGPGREEQDRPVDAAARDRYHALFPALRVLTPSVLPVHAVGRVRLSEGAQAARERVSRVVSALASIPGTSPRMKSALGKWDGLFARMCLIFHLIEIADANARDDEWKMSAMLEPPTAERVEGYMLDVLLPHLMRADAVMFSSVQTDHAKWIAGYILSRGLERVARRDLVRDYRALSAPEDARTLDLVMEGLEAMDWVLPAAKRNQTR